MNHKTTIDYRFQNLFYIYQDQQIDACINIIFKKHKFDVKIQLIVESLSIQKSLKFQSIKIKLPAQGENINYKYVIQLNIQNEGIQKIYFQEKDYLIFNQTYQTIKNLKICSQLYLDVVKNIQQDTNIQSMLEYFMEDFQTKSNLLPLQYLIEKFIFQNNIKILFILFSNSLYKYTTKILYQNQGRDIHNQKIINSDNISLLNNLYLKKMIMVIGQLHYYFDYFNSTEIKIFVKQRLMKKLIQELLEQIFNNSDFIEDFVENCMDNHFQSIVFLNQLFKYCKMYQISENLVDTLVKRIELFSIIRSQTLNRVRVQGDKSLLYITIELLYFYINRFSIQGCCLMFTAEILDFIKHFIFTNEQKSRLLIFDSIKIIITNLYNECKQSKINDILLLIMVELQLSNTYQNQITTLKFFSEISQYMNIRILSFKLSIFTQLQQIMMKKSMVLCIIKMLTIIIEEVSEDSSFDISNEVLIVLKYYVSNRIFKTSGMLFNCFKRFLRHLKKKAHYFIYKQQFSQFLVQNRQLFGLEKNKQGKIAQSRFKLFKSIQV